MNIHNIKSIAIKFFAYFGILFGILTISSGGLILFSEEKYRLAAGKYIPEILWFNFLSGFLYLYVSSLILQKNKNTVYSIKFLLFLIFMAVLYLGIHIISGGEYEKRTLIAMFFRFAFWSGMFFLVSSEKEYLYV
ncbi:MAG: hypothetical protein H7A25_08860 [Leptospiraceae bacterium]|nr:hypothetical protein [Leptospiraceae bacterium]MCP5500000.1 hypothetical protein [Leptospiraceae bacterium]